MLEVAANILYTTGLSAKFRGKHVGPVLWCVVSTRTTRRSLILLLHAFSLAHVRGCSQTRTGFCLVVLLQQAIRPARGGRTCSSGFDTVEAVVVTSLFVWGEEPSANRTLQLRTLEHAYSQALAWDKIAMWGHYCSTPSVRKYLSSKWIKRDVSRCILVLDTSFLSILMTSIFGRRE